MKGIRFDKKIFIFTGFAVLIMFQPFFALATEGSPQIYIDKYFEVLPDGSTRNNYFLGDIPLGTETLSGQNEGKYYVLPDEKGSTQVITDNQGNIVETRDYYPFGDTSFVSSSQDIDYNYTFTGKEEDQENNLQYFEQRYYDNETGRFTTLDPILNNLNSTDKLLKILTNPQRLNSYSYALNNPVSLVDPDGQYVETILDLISLGLSTYDYNRKHSFVNGLFIALDVLGVMTPTPSLGHIKNGYRTYAIAKYFHSVVKNVDDVINVGELFVKNINFKFTQRAWSAGDAGNDVASFVGHFFKHGGEVGAKNVDEYYRGANNLINSKKTHSFADPDPRFVGDTIYFDPSTNLKVATDSKGTIRTYYLERRSEVIDKYNQIISAK